MNEARKMHALLTPTLALFALISAAPAQQEIFVMPAASTLDGDSAFPAGGVGLNGRTQILLDASVLGPAAVGRALSSVSFRRDHGFQVGFTGWQTTCRVTVGQAPFSASSALPRFDENVVVGSTLQTFDATVSIPTSAPITTRPPDWASAQDTVTLQFTDAYAYGGGTLCIEIEGTAVGDEEFWAVDAFAASLGGSALPIGSSCGQLRELTIPSPDLILGHSAALAVRGPADLPAAFLIGGSLAPLELTAFGAAGCYLHLVPSVVVPTAFDQVASIDTSGRAAAVLDLHVPDELGLLGLTLRAQVVTATVPLQTTNAVEFSIASLPSTLGVSMVVGPAASTRGRVWTSRAPAMRLTFD